MTLTAVNILFFAGILLFLRQLSRRKEIVEKIQKTGKRQETHDKETPSSTKEASVKKPILNMLGFLGKSATPEGFEDYSRMRIKFLKAGIRVLNAPAIFYGAKILLMMFLPFFFLLVRITFLGLTDPTASMIICLILAISGFYLPDIWLAIRTDRRKKKILDGIPDVLDLLVVCVEAGMGMDAAFSRIAEEIRLSSRVLSDELKLFNLEVRAGKQRQDALRNLAVRTDLDDMKSLVTMLIQTEKFGTSVGQALRVFSDSFRTKRYQKVEEIASKLPVKLLFPSVLFIFPALFVAILGPAVIRIYYTFMQQ